MKIGDVYILNVNDGEKFLDFEVKVMNINTFDDFKLVKVMHIGKYYGEQLWIERGDIVTVDATWLRPNEPQLYIKTYTPIRNRNEY